MPGHQIGDGAQVPVRLPGPLNQACLCNSHLAFAIHGGSAYDHREYELQEISQGI